MEIGAPSYSPSEYRASLGWVWGPLAAIALVWPGHLSGPLDGMPLDRDLEAVLIGLVFPALWWLHPEFLRTRLVRAATLALLITKIAGSLLAQDGWCVRFDPPGPVVKDSTGRPHSWDIRADWRAGDPACSAVMTAPYSEFKEFPVWFYNLPPIDDNSPTANDRPPYVTLPMSIVGFLDVRRAGVLDLQSGPGMGTAVLVDGRPANADDPQHQHIDLDVGVHFVQVSATLSGNRWRLVPRWNGRPLGSFGFPPATLTRPSDFDRLIRPAANWFVFGLASALLLAWLGSALMACGHVPTLVWTVGAAASLSVIGSHPATHFATTNLARWSVSALGASLLLSIPSRLRNLRGAFLLIGVPWLTFVAAVYADHIGKFSFYTGGEDSWTFQRFAYRIYLQGYWLEGGQATFWFQPFYRWIAGGLHVVFGDSSVGEFYWDGVCLLAAALFAFQVVSLTAGFRWGLAAAVTTLTVVMHGPTWGFVGQGLSEISSAGLLYMAALIALGARRHGTPRFRAAAAAGVLATLAFYVRLNNLPMALGVAILAMPLDVPARGAWRPATWMRRTSWGLAGVVIATISLGLLFFAWRTWYYTGVFSPFYGTQLSVYSLWVPGLPFTAVLERMGSSLMMVLTLNDPPRVAIYSLPLLSAAVVSLAALVGARGFRELPLALVLFFAAACSGALVARGNAYSGRFSTHLLGIGGAVVVSAVAMMAGGLLKKPSN